MTVTFQLRQIEVSPGQCLTLNNINWDEFEAILAEMGEHRGTRIAYHQGVLEIRMPLPEHEINKELITAIIQLLLEELDMDWHPYGSTTFKSREMLAGIEPDTCFYIKNYQQMIGKFRLNLAVDPPPDLAVEIDLTSKTQKSAYVALGVPELWVYTQGKLEIFVLQDGEYLETEKSPTFGELPVIEGITQFLNESKTVGARLARRSFREWAREQIGKNQASLPPNPP